MSRHEDVLSTDCSLVVLPQLCRLTRYVWKTLSMTTPNVPLGNIISSSINVLLALLLSSHAFLCSLDEPHV